MDKNDIGTFDLYYEIRELILTHKYPSEFNMTLEIEEIETTLPGDLVKNYVPGEGRKIVITWRETKGN